MKSLDREALAMAKKAHKGQVDKAGVEYIYHPMKVASLVKGTNEKCVAYLHDVLEDTEVSAEEIRKKFGDRIADTVECLTRRDGEEYMDYIRRIKKNPIAVKVKLADLTHNMDLKRLKMITEKDLKRVEKYKTAYSYLKEG